MRSEGSTRGEGHPPACALYWRHPLGSRKDRDGTMQKPTIAIIGPGRAGSALGRALHTAGYTIAAIGGRKPRQIRKPAGEVGGRAPPNPPTPNGPPRPTSPALPGGLHPAPPPHTGAPPPPP